MNLEEDEIRMKAFEAEISRLNEKYILKQPIKEYFELIYRPQRIQRRFSFHFFDNIDLPNEVRIDCLNIFLKYFPDPEGAHGLVG